MAKGATDLGKKQSMSGKSIKDRKPTGYSNAPQPSYSGSMKAQGTRNPKSGKGVK